MALGITGVSVKCDVNGNILTFFYGESYIISIYTHQICDSAVNMSDFIEDSAVRHTHTDVM